MDAIVEGPNFEFATETREELYYDKESCSRTATAGSGRSQSNMSNWTRRIGEGALKMNLAGHLRCHGKADSEGAEARIGFASGHLRPAGDEKGDRYEMLAAIAFYALSRDCRGDVRVRGHLPRSNPVHSVLFLILTFFTAAGLFVSAGRRVPGDDPGRRLCRRRGRSVPLRRDDARRRLRRVEAGHSSILCCRSAP